MPTIAASPQVAARHHRRSRMLSLRHQVGIACGWFIVSFVLSMMVWVLVPRLALGWTPLVVASGSMEPSVRPGDVVLIDPKAPPLVPGAVVAFSRDGTTPVLHRVIEKREDGSLITKGDANQGPDSTPVSPDEVLGYGRLVVPFVGYPRLWMQQGAGFLIVLAVGGALYMRRRKRLALVIASLFLIGWFMFSTTAAFADLTENTSSSVATITLDSPSDLTASCGSVSVNTLPITLAWSGSPTPGLTEYQILYGLNSAPSQVVVTVPASQTTAEHVLTGSGLQGTHNYAVRAALGSWTSPNSNTDTVTVTQILLVISCQNN